jgi:hypothetical protein
MVTVRSLVAGPRAAALLLRGEYGGTRTVPILVKDK